MAGKNTRRGFVRSTTRAANTWATVRAAFERASARHAREYAAYEAAPDGSEEDAALETWHAARAHAEEAWRQLMATPAPDAEALAFKILQHRDVPALDVPAELARIAERGDDEEQAWLAIYLDAKRLAGGDPAPPTDDGARFLAWEEDATRALAEYARRAATSPDDEEADRLYNRGLDLLQRILVTPGQGSTVAAVKLRALLHPDVGVASLIGSMGRDDAEGIYTALGALTGETPFNPFAWIRDYEAAGGRVRKVRVALGSAGRAGHFALMFSRADTSQAEAACQALQKKAEGQAWPLFHAAQREVMPGAAARTAEQVEHDERAEGRVLVAIVFPPRQGEG